MRFETLPIKQPFFMRRVKEQATEEEWNISRREVFLKRLEVFVFWILSVYFVSNVFAGYLLKRDLIQKEIVLKQIESQKTQLLSCNAKSHKRKHR